MPDVPPAALPPLYARWMAEWLPAPVPPEPLSTCHDCAMCAKPGVKYSPGFRPYRADVKCCSYHPELPNFLVGRALDDDGLMPEGRASLEARIAARAGVTPLGLAPAPMYQLMYARASQKAFGRTRTLICPHFVDRDGGLCGIWRHRNGVCATYFCRFDRGPVGAEFWSTLNGTLSQVERALSLWCASELGLSPKLVASLSNRERRTLDRQWEIDDLDAGEDSPSYRARWGDWAGREVEYFVAAGRLVAELTWDQALQLVGTEGAIRARATREAFIRMQSPDIPEFLVLRDLTRVSLGAQEARVSARGRREWLDLPTALVDVLGQFDGRTRTRDVQLAIVLKTRTVLEPWLIRRLVDHGILAPPPGEDGPEPEQEVGRLPGLGRTALPVMSSN
jgi:hypothetical protein